MESSVQKKIVKISELPSKVQEMKRHIYYVLTEGNLLALAKKDHTVQQQYYRDHLDSERPRLLEVSTLVI